MKSLFSILTVAALLCGFTAPRASAAESSAADTDAAKDVRAVIKKVQAKLQQGKDKEADFNAELKEFDTLIAKYKTTAPDAAGEAAFMKALLYVQVIDDNEKGAELMRGVKKDFGGTKFGKQADQALASIEHDAEAKKIADSLKPGAKFPDFTEKDVDGKSLSLANYKGKTVLVDFWATWCGPCKAELPNVIETYNKYHAKGFEIVGISLDTDKEKLKSFIKEKDMTWQQYFDGKGWQNKLSTQYGITAIPATFLLDGEGKIIARNVRGEALGEAVGKALAQK